MTLTPDAIVNFNRRIHTSHRFLWRMLITGMLIITAATSYFMIVTNYHLQSTKDKHLQILQHFIPKHPLHALWPEIKACGGNLQNMSDLLIYDRPVDDSVNACESHLLKRLYIEQRDWQWALDNASENIYFSHKSRLLLKEHIPDNPLLVLFSLIRICNIESHTLTFLKEWNENGESPSKPVAQQLYCVIVEQLQLNKLSTDTSNQQITVPDLVSKYDESLWSYGVGADYYEINVYRAVRKRKAPVSSMNYWEIYRIDNDDDSVGNHIPSGSFLKALHHSWQSGESIRPVDKVDEFRTYRYRNFQLLMPIVIDGATQAIFMSELNSSNTVEFIKTQWLIFRIIIVIILLLWLAIFFWQDHRTLKKIPRGMDLSRWQVGMWRPSLTTLSLTDGFRYFNLFHLVFFFLFSLLLLIISPQEFWHEELTWGMWLTHIAIMMSIPLFISLFVIPKMISDYRLFARGIPVSCKRVGSKTESLTTGYMRNGFLNTNTEHYNRDLYEAIYKDKLYQFSAPAMALSGEPTIALIDPEHPKHSLLLNAFYE